MSIENDNPNNQILGDISLPLTSSDHIVIDKELKGSKRDRNKGEEVDLLERQKAFEKARNFTKSVCILRGIDCTKVNVSHHLQGQSQYSQLGSEHFRGDVATVLNAIPNLSQIQKEHLADCHYEDYVKNLVFNYREQVTHRWMLEKIFFELRTAEAKLEAHKKIKPSSWPWGQDAAVRSSNYANKLELLETEKRRLEASWYELLNLEKEKEYLKQIGNETRREINERVTKDVIKEHL